MWKCSESEGNVFAIKNSRIQLFLSNLATFTPQSFREWKEKGEQLGEMDRNRKRELKGEYV